MRLLIYTHAFAPNLGGIETIIMSLARELAGASVGMNGEKIDLTLVTSQAVGRHDDSLLPFPVVRRPSHWHLFQLLRSAELVHLAGPALLPLLLALILRKPVVIEHHGFQAICPNGQLVYQPDQQPCPGHFMARRHRKCLQCNSEQGSFASWKLWLLTFPRRWLCLRATANITPTQWLSDLLQLRRMVAIHHGLMRPAAARESTPRTPPIIVFQGRLVSAKGAHILLRAASKLKAMGFEFQLKIVGDGPERLPLETLTTDLNLIDRVRFFGSLPCSELEGALAGAMAVVMPSLGGEVFGLVAAENMARGHLVVVSNLGALVEIVGDGGISFRTGDADHLSAKLAALFESPHIAVELRQRAIQRCADLFGLPRMVESHIAVYRKMSLKEEIILVEPGKKIGD